MENRKKRHRRSIWHIMAQVRTLALATLVVIYIGLLFCAGQFPNAHQELISIGITATKILLIPLAVEVIVTALYLTVILVLTGILARMIIRGMTIEEYEAFLKEELEKEQAQVQAQAEAQTQTQTKSQADSQPVPGIKRDKQPE